MSRFYGWNNAFQSRKANEGVQSLIIRGVGVFNALVVAQPCVLGSDGGVIQTGGNAVGHLDLAVFILQNVGAGALEHSK